MTIGDRRTWRTLHRWKPTGYADNRGYHYKCQRCGELGYTGGVFDRFLPNFGCEPLTSSTPCAKTTR